MKLNIFINNCLDEEVGTNSQKSAPCEDRTHDLQISINIQIIWLTPCLRR